jgi:hypothetical protein
LDARRLGWWVFAETDNGSQSDTERLLPRVAFAACAVSSVRTGHAISGLSLSQIAVVVVGRDGVGGVRWNWMLAGLVGWQLFKSQHSSRYDTERLLPGVVFLHVR